MEASAGLWILISSVIALLVSLWLLRSQLRLDLFLSGDSARPFKIICGSIFIAIAFEASTVYFVSSEDPSGAAGYFVLDALYFSTQLSYVPSLLSAVPQTRLVKFILWLSAAFKIAAYAVLAAGGGSEMVLVLGIWPVFHVFFVDLLWWGYMLNPQLGHVVPTSSGGLGSNQDWG